MSKRAKHVGLFRQMERTLLGVHGVASGEARAAAMKGTFSGPTAVLLSKVEQAAWTVTPEDLKALRATHSDDEVFDLILCASFGAVKRRHERALAAIDEAWGSEP